MKKFSETGTSNPESRDAILNRIRKNKPEAKPLPEICPGTDDSVSKDQLLELFKENLLIAGADFKEIMRNDDLKIIVETSFPEAINLTNKTKWKEFSTSFEEAIKTGTVIIEGQFGVAENGAIWFDETNLPNRLLPFIAEHLVVILRKGNIVGTMYEAYSRNNIDNTGFGVFISGPSKTADIEQSLVIGAHGAKKMEVLLQTH